MLIEAPFKKDDVVVLKTVSGDEVIGRFVEKKSDGTIVLRKALVMNLIMGQNGQGGVAMVPFMVGADETASLPFTPQHVITSASAQKAAAAGYIQQTTGIAVPQSPPSGLSNMSN